MLSVALFTVNKGTESLCNLHRRNFLPKLLYLLHLSSYTSCTDDYIRLAASKSRICAEIQISRNLVTRILLPLFLADI
jgi:hypothetical protein